MAGIIRLADWLTVRTEEIVMINVSSEEVGTWQGVPQFGSACLVLMAG
jgi:hypothetical protein